MTNNNNKHAPSLRELIRQRLANGLTRSQIAKELGLSVYDMRLYPADIGTERK